MGWRWCKVPPFKTFTAVLIWRVTRRVLGEEQRFYWWSSHMWLYVATDVLGLAEGFLFCREGSGFGKAAYHLKESKYTHYGSVPGFVSHFISRLYL